MSSWHVRIADLGAHLSYELNRVVAFERRDEFRIVKK
jgi:hypothetical protein